MSNEMPPDIMQLKCQLEFMREQAEKWQQRAEFNEAAIEIGRLALDAMKQRADAAEATVKRLLNRTELLEQACGEMREFIEAACGHYMAMAHGEPAENLFMHIHDNGKRALTSDAGTNYLSPEQVKEQVKPLVEWIKHSETHEQHCGYDIKAEREKILNYAKAKGLL